MSLMAYNIHGDGHKFIASGLKTQLVTRLKDVVSDAQTLTLPGASHSILHIYLHGDLPWYKRWIGRLRVVVLMNTNAGGYKLERLC